MGNSRINRNTERIPDGLNEMWEKLKLWKFELSAPDIVLVNGWYSQTIALVGNMPKLIFHANEPKIIVVVNTNSGTPIFLGSIPDITGFPVLQNQRLILGMCENTSLYAFCSSNININLIDTGI